MLSDIPVTSARKAESDEDKKTSDHQTLLIKGRTLTFDIDKAIIKIQHDTHYLKI